MSLYTYICRDDIRVIWGKIRALYGICWDNALGFKLLGFGITGLRL